MHKILSILTVLAMTGSAVAGPVYSTHQEGCAWRKNPDQYPKDFESITYLDAKGLRGWEWGCDFMDSKVGPNGRVVHTSSCSIEGTSWPDVLLVEPSYKGYHVITKDKEEPLEFPYRCE